MPESRATDQWRPAIITASGSTVSCVILACLAVAATGIADSTMSVVRAAVQVWLVAVGATLTTDGTAVDIVPIGMTALVVVIVLLVTRFTVRTPLADPGAFGAMTGGVAGVLAGIGSAVTSSEGQSTSFVRAAFGAFLVVGFPAAWAAARRSDVAWLGLPSRWTPLANGAATAVTGVLGGAAVITLVMLVLNLDRASDLWATLDPDNPVLLGLMCALAIPTLVLWTTAVLLGPGFAVGADTSVDLAGSSLGQVPGFPPLAGLPDPGPFGGWVVVLMLIPLFAGVCAGLVVHTRTAVAARGWGRVLGDGAGAGVVAGLVLGAFISTSHGAIGPGLMQTAGPSAWRCLLVAVPLLAAGGAIGSAGAHYRSGRDRIAT